jgi:hypothetical protein
MPEGEMHGPDSPRPVPAERELRRLDPWSFHVLPGDGAGCDRLVIGTTGAFALVFVGESVPSGIRAAGVGRARRAARKLRGRLSAMGSQVDTFAIVCPRTHAVFAPRTVRGVRIVPPVLLAGEISGRNRAAMPHQVRRAAESLSRSFARSR